MAKHSNRQKFRRLFHDFTALVVVFLLQLCIFGPLSARGNCPDQGPRLSAQEYCRLYAAEAQRQMQRYGIPASITLAQGMFESGYGSSYIAVKGNNHFGIKAYRGWSGPVVRCDDDKSNEPFCKFKSVLEGFEHHSKFLHDNSRYAPLFKLSPTDYVGWAKGLQKCGYATNPKYPELLCDIIKRYSLHQYDTKKGGSTVGKTPATTLGNRGHKLYTTTGRRGLKFVRTLKNDDLATIGREFGIKERQLRKWNDLPKKYRLREGEIIYLQAKRSKADKQYPTHLVKGGESLQSISQQYGVTVHSLIRRNKLTTANVRPGQILKLR